MKRAVIVDCIRTPIGRAHKDKGIFREVRSDDLAVQVVQALVERTGINPDEVEDVVLGNTQQQGEQGMNAARVVSLMAGLATHTGGTTVNRLCGSSLQAINQASHAIMAGFEDVQIVGGLEHMQHIPMDAGVNLNPKLFHRTSKGALAMGVTAEFLAQTQGISREEQDKFALRSHKLAAEAQAKGEFKREMIPVYGRDEAGNRILVDFDQCVRADASMESLAALKPAFMPGMGTVTAGNSSPLNDGAAALLVMSEDKAKELGLKPLVPRRRHRRRRRRSVRDGHRTGAGHQEGPQAGRPAAIGYRRDRVERSLRLAGNRLHADAQARRGEDQRPRRIGGHRPPVGCQRCSDHDDADQQHGRPRRESGPGHDVHRRGPGNRHDFRARLISSRPSG